MSFVPVAPTDPPHPPHTHSQLSESDRTGAVIHNALEKHGLYSNTSYSLSQVLDGNSTQDIVAQLELSLIPAAVALVVYVCRRALSGFHPVGGGGGGGGGGGERGEQQKNEREGVLFKNFCGLEEGTPFKTF